MSEITNRIKTHFEAIGRREIVVPEWDLTIYSTPVTLAEKSRIYAGTKDDNDYEICARVLLVKAQDKDGNKLFTLEDKAVLLQKADSNVLIRVAHDILSSDAPSATELKN